MQNRTHAKQRTAKQVNWTLLFTGLTTLATVAATVFAIYQYRANTVRIQEETARQERQARLDKQTNLYTEASRAAHAFSEVDSLAQARDKKLRLFEIFGEATVLGNNNVTEAMKKYCDEIKKWENYSNSDRDEFFLRPSRYQRDGVDIFYQLATDLSKAIQDWLSTSRSKQTSA